VGFTAGSRGKVPGKTCEKRIRNNNNNNNMSSCKHGNEPFGSIKGKGIS
jgi:hypothetical protein